MTKKNNTLFAIDLGNKNVKLKDSLEETIIIPSRYANKALLSSNRFDSLSNSFKNELDLHTYQLSNRDEVFYFGKDINKLNKDSYVVESLGFGMDRYSKKQYAELLSFSIAELGKKYDEATSGVLTIDLVLGVPTDDYSEEILTFLTKTAKKQHSVTIDGNIDVNVKVDKVYILPQPMGTFYNILLNDDLSLTDKELINQKIGIVDIGGATVLYDTIQNFEFDEDSRSQNENGIYTLYSRISNNTSLSFSPNKYQVEQIIKDGSAKGTYIFKPNSNDSIDMTSTIENEINATTQQIVSELPSVFKHHSNYDKICFTGGGSLIVNRDIINEQIKNAQFVENSDIANIRGYYLFGLHQQLQ